MKNTKSLLTGNIGIVLLLILVAASMMVKSRYSQEIFVQLFLWAGLGCAWNLNCGYCRRNSIGHAVFFGFGAYSTALIYSRTPLSPWIGMLVGVVLCAVIALGLGRATLRLRGIFFTLTTQAFGEVVHILSVSMKNVTNGSQGIVLKYVPGIMNMTFESKRAYIIMAFIYMMVMLILCIRLEHSKFGYQLIAIGQDTEAAQVLGVNSAKVMTKSYVESAIATAIGGSIYAMYYLYIDPDSVFGTNQVSLQFVLIGLVGGMGLAYGPILGACILIPLSNILRAQFAGISGLNGFAYGLIMLLIVMARPDGLLSYISYLWHKFLDGRGSGGADSELDIGKEVT